MWNEMGEHQIDYQQSKSVFGQSQEEYYICVFQEVWIWQRERLIISSVEQRKSFGQKECSVMCGRSGRHELLKELEKVSLRIWAFCTFHADVVEFERRVGSESLFLRRERTWDQNLQLDLEIES